MGNGHGGRKVKVLFGSNDRGEVCFRLLEVAYPHSDRSKRFSGCGEWTIWEQSVPHRPAQAFKELFFALRDLELIDNTIGVEAAVEYWAKDLDSSRVDRLRLVEDYKKKLQPFLETLIGLYFKNFLELETIYKLT